MGPKQESTFRAGRLARPVAVAVCCLLGFAQGALAEDRFPLLPGSINTGSASAVGTTTFKYRQGMSFRTTITEGPGANERTIQLHGFFVPGGVAQATLYSFVLPIILPPTAAQLRERLGDPSDSNTQTCINDEFLALLANEDLTRLEALAPADQDTGLCDVPSQLWREALTQPIDLVYDMSDGSIVSESIPATAIVDQDGGVPLKQEFDFALTTDAVETQSPCNIFGRPFPGREFDPVTTEASLVSYMCLDDFDTQIVFRTGLSLRVTGFPLPEPSASLGGLAAIAAVTLLRRRRRVLQPRSQGRNQRAG